MSVSEGSSSGLWTGRTVFNLPFVFSPWLVFRHREVTEFADICLVTRCVTFLASPQSCLRGTDLVPPACPVLPHGFSTPSSKARVGVGWGPRVLLGRLLGQVGSPSISVYLFLDVPAMQADWSTAAFLCCPPFQQCPGRLLNLLLAFSCRALVVFQTFHLPPANCTSASLAPSSCCSDLEHFFRLCWGILCSDLPGGSLLCSHI